MHQWLTLLGLDRTLRQYPAQQLIEWRWLCPQKRIALPRAFFDAFPSFPFPEADDLELNKSWRNEWILWDTDWIIDPSEPLWFLDDFFHPGGIFNDRLDGGSSIEAAGAVDPAPPPFMHENGFEISPYIDYFYHWQAYALIDILSRADRYEILDTPDAASRMRRFAEHIETDPSLDAREIVAARWRTRARAFTWLSHYRSMREALDFKADRRALLNDGAQKLAHHLGFQASDLEDAIRSVFLVQAQEWNWSRNGSGSNWIDRAWPELKRDIYFAVEWLCLLTSNPIEHYLDLYSYSHFGQLERAELQSVLEIGWYADEQVLLRYQPTYIKLTGVTGQGIASLPNDQRRSELRARMNQCPPMRSMLSAFRALHEDLPGGSSTTKGPDWRVRRPVDHFSSLALRVETCLRFAVVERPDPSGRPRPPESLKSYFKQLFDRQRFDQLIGPFDALTRGNSDVTRLNEMGQRENYLNRLIQLDLSSHQLSGIDEELLRCSLVCMAARNYFAHHYDQNPTLVQDDGAAFLLGAALLCLWLLIAPQISEAT